MTSYIQGAGVLMAKAVSRKVSSVFIVPFSIGQSLCTKICISKETLMESNQSRVRAVSASSF